MELVAAYGPRCWSVIAQVRESPRRLLPWTPQPTGGSAPPGKKTDLPSRNAHRLTHHCSPPAPPTHDAAQFLNVDGRTGKSCRLR